MSSKRTTNNSVATLEEQSDVLNSILTSETQSKEKEVKTKKASKRKLKTDSVPKKVKTVSKQSLQESHLSDHEDAGMTEGQWPTWADAQAHLQAVQAAHFSNYVPGFNFGVVEQPQWVQEEEDTNTEHMISDKEDTDTVVSEQEIHEVVEETKKLPEVNITGVFANAVKEKLTHVKEADRVAPKLSPAVAVVLENFLKDSIYSSEMEKLSKEYPRVENVQAMKVPRLDTEIYQVIEQRIRNMDHQFQSIQKGMMAAIGGLCPLLQLLSERGDTDKELDECSKDLLNSLQLISFAINGISARRRDIIRPCLAPVYAQVLSRGHETTPDWLFGGNLLETTRKCEASKRISDKILKKKPQPQQQMKQQRFQGPRQFRPRQMGTGMMKAYNPYQQSFRMQAPQGYYQAQFPLQQQQMGFQGEYPRQQRPQYSQFQGQQQTAFPRKQNPPQK